MNALQNAILNNIQIIIYYKARFSQNNQIDYLKILAFRDLKDIQFLL